MNVESTADRSFKPSFLFFILASVILIGLAAWFPALWFLGFIALLPFYFVVDFVLPFRAFKFATLFVVLAPLVLGFPLLSFRSVQSLAPTSAQHFVLDIILLTYIFLLAALSIAALWAPLAVLKKWYWRIFAVPLAWVLFEFVKAKLSFDLQWISAGELLVDFLPLGIFARFGGVLLLSFFVFAINISLYESVKLFLTNQRAGIKLFAGVAIFWVLLSASGFAYTKYLLARESDLPETKVRVAIIQPGSAQGRGNINFYTDARRKTREIVKPEDLHNVDLLIFPGNYFGLLTQKDFEAKNPIVSTLGFNPNASTSIIGFSLFEQGKKYQTNAVISGNKIQLAYKERLFPMSDYIPPIFQKISGSLAKLSSGYAPGRNEVMELLPDLKGGVLFCSEEFVPSIFSRLQKEGAKIIIVSGSNDDFTSPTAYREVLRTGRLRALENGVWIVQVMRNGISAIIDPFGRVVKSLGKDERGVLIGEVIVKN